MIPAHQFALWARQDASAATNTTDSTATADPATSSVPECDTSSAPESYLYLRVVSIFVIFIGSALGALLPVYLAKYSKVKGFKTFFFITKYFGSGIILSTAFMHLLSPASDNLRDECLGNILPDYDFAIAICLMTVMVMFLVELLVSQVDFSTGHKHEHKTDIINGVQNGQGLSLTMPSNDVETANSYKGQPSPSATLTRSANTVDLVQGLPDHVPFPGGEEHLCHQHEHTEGDSHAEYAAQMTGIFILEFGVIFHSVFIGLTLAITDNFIILFIVLVFHQLFEGLGLGSRLGTATWPKVGFRKYSPHLLALGYAVSTPLAIAIGLAVRQSLSLDGATAKIVNGSFDAVSSGILLYTGLVELLAHEFMFNPDMRKAGLRTQLNAYACVAAGVALMALLAKWA